jgi:hypothetical protein
MPVYRAAALAYNCEGDIVRFEQVKNSYNFIKTYQSRFKDTDAPNSKALPSIDIHTTLSVTTPAGFDELKSLIAF